MNFEYIPNTYGIAEDCTPAVAAALDECQRTGERRLVFPKGRYDFWPDYAGEQYLFVSNNDESLKRIVFPLDGFEDFEIDGQGSEFIFHGYVVPFTVIRSKNIKLSNITIDWHRTFHSEGIVLASSEGSVDIHIPEQFPYKIAYGKLVFTGEGSDTYGIGNILEFDTVKRETAFRVFDNYAVNAWHAAEEIGPREVRFQANFATQPTPGNTLAIMDGHRYCPGIIVSDSADILLSHVTIHHCGGMGVIAQRTRDIRLEHVDVVPRPDGGRMISATADATHFVNCAGHVEIESCRLENQMDDPLNVHGIYARISAVLSEREIEVELVHIQQLGIDITMVGDTLEFVHNESLETYHLAEVTAVKRINKRFTRLTLKSPLPNDAKPGDVVASRTWIPDLTIRNTRSRGNRARGFLITTGGKVLVENNYFHIPGAAILIEGDANYWFESGAVRDITIRGNHFDNCNYGVWGRSTVEINGAVAPEHRCDVLYHSNIHVENNRFDDFNGLVLSAHCVDGLTFRNNTICASTDYPRQSQDKSPFDIEYCRNVDVSQNIFEQGSQ